MGGLLAAATAGAAAAVLSWLFPDEAAAFEEQAQQAVQSRLLAGVEYPSDVEAGLALGRQVAELVIARGMAAAEIARQRRLRVLNTLRASIAKADFAPPALASTLPTIGTPLSATAIASGTTWQDVRLTQSTTQGWNWTYGAGIQVALIEPGAFHTGFNQAMTARKYEWMATGSYFSGQTARLQAEAAQVQA